MSSHSRSHLANLYLALAIVGYLAPGIPTVLESVQAGNILFWTNPVRTMTELFVNRTTTAFALDLFATALVAGIWMFYEGRRIGMRNVWRYWVLTLLFGLGGTLPLFLWSRERLLASANAGPVMRTVPTPAA